MTLQQARDRLNEAIAHQNSGRFERAEAIYRHLAPVVANTHLVYELWARLAERQGRLDDAIRLYQQALRIDPLATISLIQLTTVLISVGRVKDAERLTRCATEAHPAHVPAWNALGYALKMQGRINEALACHLRASELNPRAIEAWFHIGFTFCAVGRNREALPYFEQALKLDPKHLLARYGRAQALHKLYRIDEALPEYSRVIEAQPENLEARSFRLFALMGQECVTREQLFQEHVAYGRALTPGPASLTGYNGDPERRLRVAIHSPDLRTHSCAYFLEPLLKGLERERIELILYHDSFIEDDKTAQFRALASVWRNFVGQSNATVEQAIRADRPDVLIDLTGHVGAMIRLPVFARRLAPAQITYLGYPDTTGVPNMDFRFTDSVADPVGEADAFATESLVRFAPTAWAYQPPVDAPAVAPLPSQTTGCVTFGCFNSPTKFTPGLYRVWARLLERVRDARLLLKGRDFDDAGVRALLCDRMRAAGIPLERVELLPRTASTAEHLAQYARVDIALDTFPYNGTTMTCEALWMGRPVVTLCGNRHASRVGASLLATISKDAWIARNEEAYIAAAAGLAGDAAALARQSAGLRGELLGSTLLDHAGQSTRFWQAVRQCWIKKVAPDGAPTLHAA